MIDKTVARFAKEDYDGLPIEQLPSGEIVVEIGPHVPLETFVVGSMLLQFETTTDALKHKIFCEIGHVGDELFFHFRQRNSVRGDGDVYVLAVAQISEHLLQRFKPEPMRVTRSSS